MAWVSKYSGLPTLSVIPDVTDSYAAGAFSIGAGGSGRDWDSGLVPPYNAPKAYVDLATISASVSAVLRVTARFSALTHGGGDSDIGGGVALYGPGNDDASWVRSMEFDPTATPGDGDVEAAVEENGVHNLVGSNPLIGTAAPPNQFRIYWNGTGSAFIIPDAGFGSWSVAAGTASYWRSIDDGTTWVREGDRAIDPGVVPTRAAIWARVGIPGGGGSTITFSNLEVMEESGPAVTASPQVETTHPVNGQQYLDPDTDVAVNISDLNGDLDATTVIIEIDDVVAWTGDAAQPGFGVTKTVITNGFRYVVNPVASFVDGQHRVRVYAEDAGTRAVEYIFTFGVGDPVFVDTAAIEDSLEFPTAGGPPAHSDPYRVGRGQEVPGPPHQQLGSIGPFDTGAYEDGPLTVPTAGGPTQHQAQAVPELYGVGQHLPQDTGGYEDGPLTILPAGGPAQYQSQLPAGQPLTALAIIEDRVLVELDPDATYKAAKTDGDGKELLGNYEATRVLLYDTAGEPWASAQTPGNGFYGADINGDLYYDGNATAFGDFGTLANGLRKTAWAVPGATEPLSSGSNPSAVTVSVPADGEVRFQTTVGLFGYANAILNSMYRWYLEGDFDVEVSWKNYTGSGGTDGGFAFFVGMSTSTHAYLRRRSPGGEAIDSDVRVNDVYGNYAIVGTAVTTGKFRYTRVGSNLTRFYDIGGGWVQLGGVVAIGTERVWVQAEVHGDGGLNVDATAYNPVVNSGTISTKIGWSREAGGTHRSNTAAFPTKALLVSTNGSLDIIDVNNDKLWMRFLVGTNNVLYNAAQRANRLAMKDGVLLIGYGSSVTGGSIWVDFNLDWIRIHQPLASGVTGADYRSRWGAGADWARSVSIGHIIERNGGRGYANDYNAWEIPDYGVDDVETYFAGAYAYRAHATGAGQAIHRWKRWFFDGAAAPDAINLPEHAESNEVTRMYWCEIDQGDGELFYMDGTNLYSVTKATYDNRLAGGFGGKWDAETTKALPGTRWLPAQYVAARTAASVIYVPANEGIYRVTWPGGGWELVYGKPGSGATYEILPDYDQVMTVALGVDGVTNVLIADLFTQVSGEGQVVIINIAGNTLHSQVVPTNQGRVGESVVSG